MAGTDLPEGWPTEWRVPVYPEGIRLVQTCSACPEQYDAFFDDRQIGYLRLRHGWFYAAYPDVEGEAVYTAEPKGDGCFDMTERADELEAAVEALVRRDIEERNPAESAHFHAHESAPGG